MGDSVDEGEDDEENNDGGEEDDDENHHHILVYPADSLVDNVDGFLMHRFQVV